MKLKVLACLLVFCGAYAYADSLTLVAPNAYANLEANGGLNTIMRNAGQARSYQMLYDASELTAIPVGQNILGVTWRMNQGRAPWPPSPGASWTSYDIRVSTAATTPATMSTTFANNVGGDVVLVQTGPLAIATNYFPGPAGPPNPFPTASIMFTTPFKYVGGDLLIEIRHPGGLHSSSTGYLDCVTSTGSGYGIAGKALSASSFTATTGSFSSLYVTRIEFVPEPASLVLLALGGLTLIRRR